MSSSVDTRWDDSFSQAHHWPEGSLEAELDRYNETDQPELYRAAFTALASTSIHRDWVEIDNMRHLLESPIEEAMFLGLYVIGRECFDSVAVATMDPWCERITVPYFLHIKPQAEIGKYRADFLITALIVKDWDTDTRTIQHHKQQVIVECDGHDFHERTKQQAGRDKRRDRELQELGYPVFRFTGSEIWKDAYGSARQVIEAVQGMAGA